MVYWVDNPTAVAVKPKKDLVHSAVAKWFNDQLGVTPTIPRAEWFNMIQSEMLSIADALGVKPDKLNDAQIGAALKLVLAKMVTVTSTLGDSKELAASQFLVNEVNKLALLGKEKADLVGIQANNNAAELSKKADKFVRYLIDEHINNAAEVGIYATSSAGITTTSNGYPENLNSTCVVRVSIRGGNDRLIQELFTESRYFTRVLDRRTPASPTWTEYFSNANAFPDKSGFLKNKNNSINAIISSNLLQKLSDSTTEVVSAKVVNDVNLKAVNAETIGLNADAKAINAQKKADQVPKPKAKNFVVGSDTTTYKLMTVDEVKALLNVPKIMTSSKNVNGWRLDHETGIIEQWGTANTNAQNDLVVTFPIPFPNKSFGVQALAWTGDKDINRNVILTSPVKKESFTAKVNNSSNTTFYWIAKGH